MVRYTQHLWNLTESSLGLEATGMSVYIAHSILHRTTGHCRNVAERLEADAAKHWNTFYKQNQTNFFKDRHYLTRDFPELARPGCIVLEVCAVPDVTDLLLLACIHKTKPTLSYAYALYLVVCKCQLVAMVPGWVRCGEHSFSLAGAQPFQHSLCL